MKKKSFLIFFLFGRRALPPFRAPFSPARAAASSLLAPLFPAACHAPPPLLGTRCAFWPRRPRPRRRRYGHTDPLLLSSWMVFFCLRRGVCAARFLAPCLCVFRHQAPPISLFSRFVRTQCDSFQARAWSEKNERGACVAHAQLLGTGIAGFCAVAVFLLFFLFLPSGVVFRINVQNCFSPPLYAGCVPSSRKSKRMTNLSRLSAHLFPS